MSKRRQRRLTTLAFALLLLFPVLKWGQSAAARLQSVITGTLPIGPSADTTEKADELDREIEEIGELIRKRQDSWAPAQASEPAWPAPGYFELTSDFGFRIHPILNVPKLHAGIDIRAPEGAQVTAALSGKVILVRQFPAYGQVIVIDHGGRVATVYAHLSATLVQEGDWVQQGTVIGSVGSTGNVTGPHLHYEIRQDGEPVDPV